MRSDVANIAVRGFHGLGGFWPVARRFHTLRETPSSILALAVALARRVGEEALSDVLSEVCLLPQDREDECRPHSSRSPRLFCIFVCGAKRYRTAVAQIEECGAYLRGGALSLRDQ